MLGGPSSPLLLSNGWKGSHFAASPGISHDVLGEMQSHHQPGWGCQRRAGLGGAARCAASCGTHIREGGRVHVRRQLLQF